MAEPKPQRLLIDNRLDEFRRVEPWLAGLAGAWDLPRTTAFAIDLVVNEAVTNTISYGYSDEAVHQIEIELTDGEDSVSIEIRDDAAPFDPLSQPPMVVGADLAHAPIGGRGIHLIKTYSDERHYSFISGRNHLRLLINKKP